MPGAADVQISCKGGSAARHTYDVGYSKWDAFDVEAALSEVDHCDSRPSCRVSEVDVQAAARKEALDCIDRSQDAKDLLDTAISKLKAQGVEEPELGMEAPAAEVEDVAEADLSQVCLADAGKTTGHQLAAQYQKWEEFDDMDDLEDDLDGGIDSNGMDLNALTGPADEVKQIQAHWRREAVKMAKASRKPATKAPLAPLVVSEPKVEMPTLISGPVQERPCEVAPGAKKFDDNYDKWKKFDADAALLELDNEDTTEEGKAMRLSAEQGSAMLNCEGYTKDREEYDLDQDIERNMGGLKKIIAQNFKDASCMKAEGNELMRSGRVADAIRKYREALDTLHLAREASVLMTASLAAKQCQEMLRNFQGEKAGEVLNRSGLVADLYKNLAAAQLKTSDFEGALASADEALKACADDKARYRKVTALLRLNRSDQARKEAELLASSQDPAVQKLLAEVAACS